MNVTSGETRAAILEDGQLLDIEIERAAHQRIAGNIYKGKVENVLPGMQAAFVDIGLERNAFLYVDDALAVRDARDEDEEIGEIKGVPSIKDLLKVGQEVIVQITKEPIGTKGARVVTHVTVPGRYLVLMPTLDYVGVSRRIGEDAERSRLKRLADSMRPRGMGLIVRTVAEGRSEKEISQDLAFLVKLWRKIRMRSRRQKAPSLLHKDYDLVYRLIRDYLSEDIASFTIDQKHDYDKAVELVSILSPHLKTTLRLYRDPEPIFDRYGIEEEIEKLLRRRVWLNCGGYLVFDQTEALMSIDVNTGKFIGSTSLADTVLRTNLEAASEIARQLRLRDVGGIIIVDFIDMDSAEDRRKVVARLEEALKKDKTKANVLGFTELGLVEMTRKKVKQGIVAELQRPCPYCDGRGTIASEETLAIRAEREVKRIANRCSEEAILVALHPSVASLLIGTGGANLARIEEELKRFIYVKGKQDLHLEDITVLAVGSKEEVEAKALPVRVGDVMEVEIEEPHVTNARNGIARVEGYVLDVEGAGQLVGKRVTVEIIKAFRTYAKVRVVKRPGSAPSARQQEETLPQEPGEGDRLAQEAQARGERADYAGA